MIKMVNSSNKERIVYECNLKGVFFTHRKGTKVIVHFDDNTQSIYTFHRVEQAQRFCSQLEQGYRNEGKDNVF